MHCDDSYLKNCSCCKQQPAVSILCPENVFYQYHDDYDCPSPTNARTSENTNTETNAWDTQKVALVCNVTVALIIEC